MFALPGRIFDERSLGPNALLRDGAILVQHPKDILEALPGFALVASSPAATASIRTDATGGGGDARRSHRRPAAAGPQGPALGALAPGCQRSPEELAGLAGAGVDRVLGGLLELELAGWVRRYPGPLYGRVLT